MVFGSMPSWPWMFAFGSGKHTNTPLSLFFYVVEHVTKSIYGINILFMSMSQSMT